jgi:hypothetical protein
LAVVFAVDHIFWDNRKSSTEEMVQKNEDVSLFLEYFAPTMVRRKAAYFFPLVLIAFSAAGILLSIALCPRKS